MQKLAEEKKAEALKQMNSMPGVERHGPDGYHGNCRDGRDGRGLPPSHTTSIPRQHPKQVRGRRIQYRERERERERAVEGTSIKFIRSPAEKQQHTVVEAMCWNSAA